MRKTIGGMWLLKASENEPIARFQQLFRGKQKVGKVLETIGRVSDPFYLAFLDDGEKAGGKRLSTQQV